MIEVDKVTKYYGSHRAVNEAEFTVRKGEIVGLLGPNAAGKTTLMRVMTGYLPATAGTVRIAGFDVFEKPMQVKRRVGYLPENPPLYRDMSVRSYVAFAAEIRGVPAREKKKRVDEAVAMTGLQSVERRLIENISRGFRQRTGLAQALVHRPEVLILDEPTVGLDPKQIIEIRNLIKQLSAEHTIILSSHILPEVSATCDRIVILNEGDVVAVDALEGLARAVRGGDQLLVGVGGGGGDEIAAALKGVPGVKAVAPAAGGPGEKFRVDCEDEKTAREAIFNAVTDKNWKLLEMYCPELSLEEVFLKMTGGGKAAGDADAGKKPAAGEDKAGKEDKPEKEDKDGGKEEPADV